MLDYGMIVDGSRMDADAKFEVTDPADGEVVGTAANAIVMRSGEVRYSGPARKLKEDPSLLERAYF